MATGGKMKLAKKRREEKKNTDTVAYFACVEMFCFRVHNIEHRQIEPDADTHVVRR